MIVGIRELSSPAWQPIETAPKKHGQDLLLALENGRVLTGRWGTGRYDRSRREYNTTWVVGAQIEVKPTHWMPMPPHPSALENRGQGPADAHSKNPPEA